MKTTNISINTNQNHNPETPETKQKYGSRLQGAALASLIVGIGSFALSRIFYPNENTLITNSTSLENSLPTGALNESPNTAMTASSDLETGRFSLFPTRMNFDVSSYFFSIAAVFAATFLIQRLSRAAIVREPSLAGNSDLLKKSLKKHLPTDSSEKSVLAPSLFPSPTNLHQGSSPTSVPLPPRTDLLPSGSDLLARLSSTPSLTRTSSEGHLNRVRLHSRRSSYHQLFKRQTEENTKPLPTEAAATTRKERHESIERTRRSSVDPVLPVEIHNVFQTMPRDPSKSKVDFKTRDNASFKQKLGSSPSISTPSPDSLDSVQSFKRSNSLTQLVLPTKIHDVFADKAKHDLQDQRTSSLDADSDIETEYDLIANLTPDNLASRGREIFESIVAGTNNQAASEEEVSLLIWFLMDRASHKQMNFSEGTFTIDDPEEKLWKYLTTVGYSRTLSSHLTQLPRGGIHGIDIFPENCAFALPILNKKHLLVHAYRDINGQPRILIKPEGRGVAYVSDAIHHSWDMVYNMGERLLTGRPQRTGERKERVDKSLVKKALHLIKSLKALDPTLNAPAEAELNAWGIQAIEPFLRSTSSWIATMERDSYLATDEQVTIESQAIAAHRALWEEIASQGDHPESRFGAEVVFTQDELLYRFRHRPDSASF